ncbi:MAG: SMI1/KNR4 family protein [Bacillota bacterium]|nr:SMI1/KNR4 family protein [Bacillota bacterium]
MIPDEIKTIAEELNKQGGMKFIEGATDEQLADFEAEHQICLPAKYKAWLQCSDGGEFFLPAGVQFYGVAHKPIIDVDDNDRPGDNYIVIGALATGDPILCETDSEQISIFNHEVGCIESDETYTDFIAFLKDMAQALGIGG